MELLPYSYCRPPHFRNMYCAMSPRNTTSYLNKSRFILTSHNSDRKTGASKNRKHVLPAAAIIKFHTCPCMDWGTGYILSYINPPPPSI